METLTDEIRKARKQHRCNWCGNIIQKGEKYRYAVFKDDYVYCWKEHLKCNEIFKAFAKLYHNSDGYTNEWMEECAHEYLVEKGICESCPHYKARITGRKICSSPRGHRGCIDKLYDALVKEGRIEETWEPEKHVEELRKLIVKKATSLGVLSESDADRLEKLQCMRREYLPTIKEEEK